MSRKISTVRKFGTEMSPLAFGLRSVNGGPLASITGQIFVCNTTTSATISTDSLTWVPTTISGITAGDHLTCLESNSLSRYVFGGYTFSAPSTYGSLLYGSTDGTNWTSLYRPFGTVVGKDNSVWAIRYLNSQWVCLSNSGLISSSVNGINFAEGIDPNLGQIKLNDITFGNGIFVAVGNSNLIATSSNLVSWTIQTSPFTLGALQITNIEYGNSIFMAVSTRETATSVDGINWTVVGLSYPYSSDRSRLKYLNNRWVGTGGYVYTSLDGTNWKPNYLPSSAPNPNPSNIVYTGTRFVTSTGFGIYTS